MLTPASVTALIPSWLTRSRVLISSIVLILLLEFFWPSAGLSVSLAHLAGLIGLAALCLCGLTFWSKARVEIGRRKLRYKAVRLNAGIVACIGLSFIVVQKLSLKLWNQTQQIGPVAAKTPIGRQLTLEPGKSVPILEVGPIIGRGWSGLMLTYRTAIPLNDLVALRKEVDEIWESFEAEVEHRGYSTAVISATGPEQAKGLFVTTHNSFNFVFAKKDGSWRTLESPHGARVKLDPDFIREFKGRLDSAYEHNNMNALLLYMAKDWTMTLINPGGAGSASQTLDRMKFVTVTHATLAAGTNFEQHTEIVNISIDEGRTVARVESRETDELTINGRRAGDVEHVMDVFELRGDLMLWTKSTVVIEKLTTGAPIMKSDAAPKKPGAIG